MLKVIVYRFQWNSQSSSYEFLENEIISNTAKTFSFILFQIFLILILLSLKTKIIDQIGIFRKSMK
jgi:hypothetical protein